MILEEESVRLFFPLAPPSSCSNLKRFMFASAKKPILLLLILVPALSQASVSDSIKSWIKGDSGSMSQADFERMAMQIREKAIQQTRPPTVTVPTAPVLGFGKYPY